jgi:hypothetical protein
MSDVNDQEVNAEVVSEIADGNSMLEPVGGPEIAHGVGSGAVGATESFSGPSNPNNGGNKKSGN